MGTAERREREREQRRHDILDAAREQFWANGYAGTTMPQIAEACELAPGTLYLYFPSKSALYAELLFQGYDLLLERLRTVERRGHAPEAQAGELIDAFLRFARERAEYFDIIFFVLQREARPGAEDALEPAQLDRLHEKEQGCKAVVARVLTQTRLSDRSAGPVVDAVWSMLVGVVFYFRKAGEQRFRAVADAARDMLLSAAFVDGVVQGQRRT